MNNLNFKALIWSAVLFAFAAWCTLLLLNGVTPSFSINSFRYLPLAITVDVGLWLLFVKWGWRYRVFHPWLVPFPVLHGTWHGTLRTLWVDPSTGLSPPPIKVILVIKQSFLRVDCEILSHTAESDSRSYAADFIINRDNGAESLIYTYSNRPRVAVRERSPLHDGTALLRITSKPERKLQGEYWTTRGTVGEITLSFYSKGIEESFPDVLREEKRS